MTKETYLFVKIIPNASKSEIVGWENERLKVRIAAVPEKGEANKALIRFLSDKFLIAKSQITLVQGETSRLKKVHINGMTMKEVIDLLNKYESRKAG